MKQHDTGMMGRQMEPVKLC